MSILTAYVVFLFAVLKTKQMVTKHNPVITSYVEEDVYDSEDRYDLSDPEFMIAFMVENEYTKTLINDPRFIKWKVVHYEFEDNQLKSWRFLDTHLCNEQDYAKFYEFDEAIEEKF